MIKKILFIHFLLSSLNCFAIGQKLDDFLFNKPTEGVQTEAFILRSDKVNIQKFSQGDENTRHLLWSMSKSISSLIFGVLEDRGLVKKSDSIYKYLKKEIDSHAGDSIDKYKNIKLTHLISMSSGLDWNEYYEEDPFNSDIVKLLYLEAPKGAIRFALNRKIKHPAGTKFYYSSGDTFLLMAVLQRVVTTNEKTDYPWKYFFDPMSMDAIFETDKDGVFIGSSYVYLTTKDLKKLAELILRNGRYDNQQIISHQYMDFFKSVSDVNKYSCDEKNYTYGASVWLNRPCPVNGKKRFPKSSDDLIILLGHGGQSIVIFPSMQAFAIRIARDKQHKFNFENYLLQIQKELIGE